MHNDKAIKIIRLKFVTRALQVKQQLEIVLLDYLKGVSQGYLNRKLDVEKIIMKIMKIIKL